MGRTLTFRIFRYNPYDESSVPGTQDYTLEEVPRLNVFSALHLIRDNQDPSLAFDFVCRAGICGSCAMMINGRPTLACRTVYQHRVGGFPDRERSLTGRGTVAADEGRVWEAGVLEWGPERRRHRPLGPPRQDTGPACLEAARWCETTRRGLYLLRCCRSQHERFPPSGLHDRRAGGGGGVHR